jgi:hypothetical protein
MPRQIGDRVGAILSSRDGRVEFLGYGTYAGEHVPEEAVGILAEGAREHGIKNPKIELDSGKVVYGCECWWGSEAGVRRNLEMMVDTEVVEVDIDEVRERWRQDA